MRKKRVYVVNTEFSLDNLNKEASLEDALDIAGAGNYQIFHCALMLATLSTALLEMIGNAFILPAAACDLKLPDYLRGLITSIPNIGIILTAPLWGHLADTLGRKPVLQVSSAAAGVFAFAAAFSPNLLMFALLKLAAALFLACPSSLGFAYAGEFIPRARRDKTLLICNGFLVLSTTASPVLAWGILSLSTTYSFGLFTIKSWRILTAVYALPLLGASLWTCWAKESPKFLMTKGKAIEALDVLSHIYSANSGLPPQKYPVTSLKPSEESERVSSSSTELISKTRRDSLLRKPHLKWLSLTGFLMFGLFTLLNGLFLFAPDAINKAMTGSADVDSRICAYITEHSESTPESCNEVSHAMFTIMVVTTIIYGLVVMGVSISPITKRWQLISMYATVGVTCLVSGLSTNKIVAGAAMSSLQLTSLGVGSLAAYAVRLFPTSLRGSAVGGVLMCGRLGSVVGANAAGYLLTVDCMSTFYGFSVLLFFCSGLSFLLPKDQV